MLRSLKNLRWPFVAVTVFFITIMVLTLVMNGFSLQRSANAAPAVALNASPTIPSDPQATVDFESLQDQSHPIPSNFLGVNAQGYFGVFKQSESYLTQAKIGTARIFTKLPDIFPNVASLTNDNQRNWTQLDQQLQSFQADNFQPIISLDYTPRWMEPQNQNPPGVNDCLVSWDPIAHRYPTHVLPSYIVNGKDIGIATWAQLSQIVVAHIDRNYPNLSPYYEIWNEPDITHGLCPPNSNPNRKNLQLQWYTEIYEATAPLLKQQGVKDGHQILVGGPALGFPRRDETIWIPALVNNPTLAPNLDFISYHRYFGSHSDTWDTRFAPNLYSAMQKLEYGITEGQEYVSSVVVKGLQPDAQHTPIFADEYNTFTGLNGCCRYSSEYGPLWSSLFITDILNTVLDHSSPYGPSANVPNIDYFALNNPVDGYCLFGDTVKMDCTSSANVGPYPPYYAIQLMGDPNYLDITNNAHVASAISTNAPEVNLTGFYTATKENVVVVNSSSNDYTQFAITVQNPGSIQQNANLYLLNQSNPTISTSQVSLTQGQNSDQVTVDLPPDSTIALSIPLS
jgi:hypothetical protein